ncbi:MAG: CoA transferase [Chloroflexota bacterium]
MLTGLRIIEYGEGITAPACAKHLADLGAEVIKIEPPERGDSARRSEPFHRDHADTESSGLFLYLNTNKLGITLDPTTATGRAIFAELVKGADALIENYPPGHMKALGLGYSVLKKANPLLVMTSITPFGQTGPYRKFKGSDLIAFHMGGIGMDTPEEVEDAPNQPPLRGGGSQAHFLTAITAGIATMGMLFGRHQTGKGSYLDISEYEALADNTRHRAAQYFADGIVQHRSGGEAQKPGHFGAGGLQPCKDGYVQFHVAERRMWRAFARVIGKPEWADDERFAERHTRSAHWDLLEPALRAYTLAHTKEEIVTECQGARVPCAPVSQPRDLLSSRHLKERGFFIEVDHPRTGKVAYPGAPAALSEGGWSIRRPAPLLGQHNEDILVGRLGYARDDLLKLKAAGVI